MCQKHWLNLVLKLVLHREYWIDFFQQKLNQKADTSKGDFFQYFFCPLHPTTDSTEIPKKLL